MDWKPIPKSPEKWRVQPNFTNDAKICSGFSWDEMRRELNGLPDERGLNIAYEAADRHASGERRDHVALRWLVADGTTCDISYWDLSAQSNRFANVLRELDAGKGGRVLALAGASRICYVAALGTRKNTRVFCPLFSAFDPEPVFQHLSRAESPTAKSRQAVGEAEIKIAIFEGDPAGLSPDENIRRALDIDSHDFLDFLTRLHKRLGIEVPEADYGKLGTMREMLACLAARSE